MHATIIFNVVNGVTESIYNDNRSHFKDNDSFILIAQRACYLCKFAHRFRTLHTHIDLNKLLLQIHLYTILQNIRPQIRQYLQMRKCC